MKHFAVIACAVLNLVGYAWAADGPWPHNLVFSRVSGGHYVKYDKPLPCPNGSLSLFLDIKNLQVSGKWDAFAGISFINKNEIARYTVSTVDRRTNALYRADSHFENGVAIFDHPIYGPIALGKKVQVELTWTQAHKMSVNIDGMAMESITFKSPITSVRFSVSGTQTTFAEMLLECGLIS